MKHPIKITLCAIALISFVSGSQAAMTTVGVLNPNPYGVTIVNSPSNSFNPVFLSASFMSILVADAYANNRGGVIDWEPANGWAANAQNTNQQIISYGAAQTNFITLNNTAGTFGPTVGSGTTPTSGTNYLGFQTGSPNVFSFHQKGLTAWGMTQLNRGASRTVTFSFTLADGTVINYNPQVQDPLGNNSGANNWYGILVNELNPIVQVSFTASGFVRFDDMAFIVSPTTVPEPTSMALFGLGSLVGIMVIRRRRNK